MILDPIEEAEPYFGRCEQCGRERHLAPVERNGFAMICDECAGPGEEDA